MQEHFNNRKSGADVSGHDVKSLKAKRICFKTRRTLPKLGVVSAEKLLLMAFTFLMVYSVTESKKPYTVAAEVIKPWVLKSQIMFREKKLQASLNYCQ